MKTLKITNTVLSLLLADMSHVCGADSRQGGNRLDSLPAARAYRIKDFFDDAWKSCEKVRVQLCQDHGTLKEDLSGYVFETPSAARAFNQGWTSLLAEEREFELPATLTEAEIDAGWFRAPDGKREKFDISAEQRGRLKKFGIIAEPTETE